MSAPPTHEMQHKSVLRNIGQIVSAHARLWPDKIGTRDSRRSFTFTQWNQRASRLANALTGLGLAKGDRVAVLAYNRVEWMEIYAALAKAASSPCRSISAWSDRRSATCATLRARAPIVQDELADRVGECAAS
jgi:non-ribosomal peptide synthetase component E (peptide arylation enzyme)